MPIANHSMGGILKLCGYAEAVAGHKQGVHRGSAPCPRVGSCGADVHGAIHAGHARQEGQGGEGDSSNKDDGGRASSEFARPHP